MERQFFTFKGWDQHDAMLFGFSNCTVVAPFGPYKAGDTLSLVCVDYGKGTIEVWATNANKAEPDWTGKLSLVVE